MESEKIGGDYRANDATPLVGEIFSGGLSVGDAIERLRTRLLDLSARNGLINYRHPKARCVQIADEPNINLSVRVHAPDDPHCVALVGFEQLAIYDEQ